MKNHVMVDLETMGTSSNAAILSIGACAFDPFKWENPKKDEKFEVNVDLEDCIKKGLKVDASTVYWWMKQSKEAQQRISLTPAALHDALVEFKEFFNGENGRPYSNKGQYIWSHGSTFDVVILENAYKTIGFQSVRTPWSFTAARDTRTLFDLAGVMVDRSKGVQHVAVHDAINQARTVCEAYKILKILKSEDRRY